MRLLRGCSGITRLACTQPWATSAPSSLNSSGIEQRKQAMEKQESKIRFPTFPQPLRLPTITSYGIRILRARSVSTQAVQPPNNERVALAEAFEAFVQLWPSYVLSRG